MTVSDVPLIFTVLPVSSIVAPCPVERVMLVDVMTIRGPFVAAEVWRVIPSPGELLIISWFWVLVWRTIGGFVGRAAFAASGKSLVEPRQPPVHTA
jgi:hypothetical protein